MAKWRRCRHAPRYSTRRLALPEIVLIPASEALDHHWLAASEKLLNDRGLVATEELIGRKAELKANPPQPTKTVLNPVYVDPGHR